MCPEGSVPLISEPVTMQIHLKKSLDEMLPQGFPVDINYLESYFLRFILEGYCISGPMGSYPADSGTWQCSLSDTGISDR